MTGFPPVGRHSREGHGYLPWRCGDLNPDLPTQVIAVSRLGPPAPVEFAEPTAELCRALLDGLRRRT